MTGNIITGYWIILLKHNKSSRLILALAIYKMGFLIWGVNMAFRGLEPTQTLTQAWLRPSRFGHDPVCPIECIVQNVQFLSARILRATLGL